MQIEIRGMGSETILVEITKEQYEYWSGRNSDALIEHLMSEGVGSDGVPEQFKIGNIFEINPVTHKYGTYSDESTLTVFADDGRNMFSCGLEFIIDEELDDVPLTEWIDSEETGKYYLQWASNEDEACVIIDVPGDDSFDLYDLKLAMHAIDGGGLVELVSYKGVTSQAGESSLGSMEVILHAPPE